MFMRKLLQVHTSALGIAAVLILWWLLLTPILGVAATVTIEDLGVLPGTYGSQAQGVSADGSVVVGFSYPNDGGGEHSFRWTRASGMQDIGVLPGGTPPSMALGVSADGSVVVGYSRDASTVTIAYRWTQAGGMQALGMLPYGGTGSFANGVSADGLTVVGTSNSSLGFHPFRWTQAGGMQDLGVLPGSATSDPYGAQAASADGTVVVGGSVLPTGQAFRWTQASGIQALGGLPGASRSYAYGISANGSVVVGVSLLPSGYHAVRWTQSGGVQDLGVLPGGSNSLAMGISADGSVVVGASDSASGYHAFRWTEAGGMQDIGTLPGGTESQANGVNADGSVIVGLSDSPSGTRAVRWTLTNNGIVGTPTGNYVAISTSATLPDGSSSNVSLTFDSVTAAGQTSVMTSSTGAPPPSGFKLGTPPVYYDITTTATISGSAQVCFNWVEGQFHNESALRLWHLVNGLWQDVTSSLNTTTNTICGQVTSLSPFILAEKSYSFTGFFQPVDNLPALNGVKAGSAVPVKFSLGGYQGMNLFDAGSPRLQTIACPSSAPVDLIDQTATSTTSGLTYDATSGQYNFVWKTDKSYAGSCMQLILDFNDGTQKKAAFTFIK